MVDKITKEKRSLLMAKVRNKNTKPEMLIRKLLFRLDYRIAAGNPIDAIEECNRDELLTLLTTPGRYALRVCGDSMIEAGIFDGDTIIVQSLQQAMNGDIVVALIDRESVTLKRIKHLPSGQIKLIADNSAISNLVYDADRITIQGKVVGQIRQYS